MSRRAKTNAKNEAIAEAERPRHRASTARVYEHPIVPIETISAAASELRADHPLVTDEQAAFVHLLVQTGKSVPQLVKLTGKNKNWAYYNMSKAHVCDYRQAVALRVLGWDSAAALATMRSLLTAKSSYIRLEAARDLLDRAGVKLEPAKPKGSVVTMNFNLDVNMAQPRGSEPVPMEVKGEVVEMGPGEGPAEGRGPSKTATHLGGGGSHTHDQGSEGRSDPERFDRYTV